MILTFSQVNNVRRVTSDDPKTSEEILAMALSSHLAWAQVNGREQVRFRAEVSQKEYEDKQTKKVVKVPSVLEIMDELIT